MDFSEEDSSEFGKPEAMLLEIHKDLLFSEQINSSEMFSTPPVLNTDTSTSHNIIILAISVLELHVHMQICHWIHMMRIYSAQQIKEL